MAEHDIKVTLDIVDNMSKPIADASKKVDTSLKQTKTAFNDLGNEIKTNFTNAIKGAVIGFVGFQAISKATQFLKESRLEFQESVRMQLQLKTALGYTSQALNEQASALGKKLIVDNEEITAVQIKLANYVKNDELVRKLTPAVLDLAAATGMDMASAANLVARGISDDNGELGRFKIAIEGAKGSSERINSVIDGLNKQFKDQSIAVAESKDGIDNIIVSWNNLKEAAGEIFGKRTEEMEIAAMKARLKYDKGGEIHSFLSQKNREEYEAKIKAYDDKNTKARLGAAMNTLNEENKQRNEKQIKDNEEKNKKLLEQDKEFYSTHAGFISSTTEGDAPEIKLRERRLAAEKQYQDQYKLVLDSGVQDISNASDASIEKLKQELEQKNFIRSQDEKNKAIAKSAANDMVNNLQLVASKHKEFAAIYKTVAIAKTLMDTFEGAQAAFTSFAKLPVVGVPLGIAAATAATLAGLARVQEIKNTKFATGTAFAPGGISLINEQGGEYVNLPRGSQVYNNTQTRNMTTNASMNVTIMDSSGNITDTLRAKIRSGQGDQLVRDIQNRLARQI